MDLVEAEQKLEIEDEDIKAIRRTKDPNWVLRGFIALAVTVLTFLIGFVIGRLGEEGVSNYPYGTALLASAVGSKKRISVLFISVLAVVSFISLSLGLVAGSPHHGVVTLYGSYSRET